MSPVNYFPISSLNSISIPIAATISLAAFENLGGKYLN